ncbi:MAG: hypothetical protein HOJ34_02245, partial [Kordiimonadaceae bacterium]|nr:hypothetical protein [Kordiimonadaceae bacterium]
ALAISIATIVPSQAQDRGNRNYNQRQNQEVVIAGPGYGNPEYRYQQPRGRNNTVIYQRNRGNQYAYGRPFFAKQNFRKMKNRKKMKRMRRMNRVYNQPQYNRPVIVIPFPNIFR